MAKNLKVTKLWNIASRVAPEDVEKFKKEYNVLCEEVATTCGIDINLHNMKPLQVVLGENGKFCMMLLQEPGVYAWQYTNFLQELSNELKRRNIHMGSVIMKSRDVRIDADKLPKKMKIKEDMIKEIWKIGDEDELFEEKQRGYVPVKKSRRVLEEEEDAKLEKQFELAYRRKHGGLPVSEEPEVEKTVTENSNPVINSMKVVMEGAEEKKVSEEIEQEEEVIRYRCENNGQLVLVF